MALTWKRTVFREMNSLAAISLYFSPLAIKRSTSSSRSVNGSIRATGPVPAGRCGAGCSPLVAPGGCDLEKAAKMRSTSSAVGLSFFSLHDSFLSYLFSDVDPGLGLQFCVAMANKTTPRFPTVGRLGRASLTRLCQTGRLNLSVPLYAAGNSGGAWDCRFSPWTLQAQGRHVALSVHCPI